MNSGTICFRKGEYMEKRIEESALVQRTIIRTAEAECLAGAGGGLLVTTDMKNPEWFAVPDVSLL